MWLAEALVVRRKVRELRTEYADDVRRCCQRCAYELLLCEHAGDRMGYEAWSYVLALLQAI